MRGLVLVAGAVAVWQIGSHVFEQRTGPEKLVNQFWIERIPAGPRDMVWHFVALERDGRRIGALGRSSRWRVFGDRFVWNQQGDQFSFETPQNGCRSQLKARTWKCAGQAPKPFELCLEFEGGGRKYSYYSREDWKIKPRAESVVEAEIPVPVMQGVFASMEADDDLPQSGEGRAACSAALQP